MDKAHFSSSLPVAVEHPGQNKKSTIRRKAAWILTPLVLAYLTVPYITPILRRAPQPIIDYAAKCAQPDALFPEKNDALDKAFEFISSQGFKNASIGRLSGAVKIKTETFDDLGAVGTDTRWEVFYGFHEYLKTTFPLVHDRLLVEKVNTHGLLYTWEGSNTELKPTVLLAHQDTVPVPSDTIAAWEYPPWSGAYDGKYIWGRGSSDCKNQLIAALETVELLLDANFKPKRTILLSFGFDEETFGYHGAGNLSEFIHKRYGNDGLAVLVDEGAGFEDAWGTTFAKPATAEKGSANVYITVRSPGGHSSIPHDHTSIGILSELITLIEATQYPTRLYDDNPYFTQLQCGAAYSPEFDPKLRKLLNGRLHSENTCAAKPDLLALEAAKQGADIKYLLQTSQAVDIISGGVKINALPERAQVAVNHRINVGETAELVFDRLTQLASQVARKYDLKLHAFDGIEEPSSIVLSHNDYLKPAPVTPSDGSVESPFSVLAGTVKAIYGNEVIVTPGIMTGNTDTRFFWHLTKHIFRFAPGYDAEDSQGLGSIHTVNEKVSVVNHINTVKWFTLFLRNTDEAVF